MNTINWVQGTWNCYNPRLQPPIHRCMDGLLALYRTGRALPSEQGRLWLRHVYREHNMLADAAANRAIASRSNFFSNHSVHVRDSRILRLKCSFDGGAKCKNKQCALAWVIETEVSPGVWGIWKEAGVYLEGATSSAAEAEACSHLIEFLRRFVHVPRWSDLLRMTNDASQTQNVQAKRRRLGQGTS